MKQKLVMSESAKATAKSLGFRLPNSESDKIRVIEKTNTLGYFNPNNWDVSFQVSELGVSLTLKKGEYVRLDDGTKVNDPVLEGCCGPGMLCKEVSDKKVNMIGFPRPHHASRDNSNASPVHEAVTFATNPDGTTRAIERPNQIVDDGTILPAPGQGKSPVTAFASMDEARALGLVKPTRNPEVRAPLDDGNKVIRDEDTPIPYIGDMLMTDMTPGEIRKLKAEKAAAELKQRQIDNSHPQHQINVDEVEESQPVMDANSQKIYNQLQESKKEADSLLDFDPSKVKDTHQEVDLSYTPTKQQVQAEPEPVVEEDALDSVSIDELNVADGDNGDPEPKPVVEAKSTMARNQSEADQRERDNQKAPKFYCPACGHGAGFLSSMKRHIRNNHKEDAEELITMVEENPTAGKPE